MITFKPIQGVRFIAVLVMFAASTFYDTDYHLLAILVYEAAWLFYAWDGYQDLIKLPSSQPNARLGLTLLIIGAGLNGVPFPVPVGGMLIVGSLILTLYGDDDDSGGYRARLNYALVGSAA